VKCILQVFHILITFKTFRCAAINYQRVYRTSCCSVSDFIRKRCHVPAIWSPNLVWSHNDQELLFVDMYVINKVPVSCSRRTRCVVVDTSLQYKRSDLICIGARTAIGTHSCVLTYTDYEQVMYRRLTHYYHREYDVCRSRQVHRMGVPMQCRTSRR
jgi:hypothetical protein